MVLAEAIGSVKRNSIKLLLSGFANTDIVGQIPVVVFYLKIAATGYSKSSQFKWKRLTPSLNNEYITFFPY